MSDITENLDKLGDHFYMSGSYEVADIIFNARDEIKRLRAENEKLLGELKRIMMMSHEAPEINMLNYDDDQVYALNEYMTDIYNSVKEALREVEK